MLAIAQCPGTVPGGTARVMIITPLLSPAGMDAVAALRALSENSLSAALV